MSAAVGVIGGSGLYELAPIVEQVGDVTICDVHGHRVAFLNRHGLGHRRPPHRVDYRANIRAVAEMGVGAIVATFACGSLVPDVEPGRLVVPDQIIDRTSGRNGTYFDDFTDGLRHAEFADPYDEGVRGALLDAAPDAIDGGTVVVIDGPRFATRAESRWYRAMGGTVINMTQYPEAVLARELDVPYGAVGLVTDWDAGVENRPDIAPVTQEAVFAEFARHLPRLQAVVLTAAVTLAG